MKILWVKAGGLVPLDTGGKIRSYHILRQLAARHEVSLFTFYAEFENDPHAELNRIFTRVEAVPLKLPPPRSFNEGLWYARNLFTRLPHSILKFCRPEVRRRLRDAVRELSPDILLCDFIIPAAAIPWDAPFPKVIFTHNVEAQIWQRHYELARNPLWRAVTGREYRAMARAEQRYLRRADHVLTVSELDREFFSRFAEPSRLTVIPTGVDTDFFRPDPAAEQPKRLVFTGSMDWLPNEDAIFYFVEEILPLIRREEPEAGLWVVGRRPSARLRALASATPALEVTGGVDDIRPYVHAAAAYVVPLRIGGGTRLKIFEAMAMGKAVVSTAIGAEGLPVTHREDILLADEPQEFASAVIEILRSEALRSRLGPSARALVEGGFGWPAIGARFGEILETVLRQSQESGSRTSGNAGRPHKISRQPKT
ncbi:MAG: glycosyltransferase [Terriglobia bacterium]